MEPKPHAFWGSQPVNRSAVAPATGEIQAELTLADFAVPQGYRAQPFLLAAKDTWLSLVHQLLLHSDGSSDEENDAEQSPFVQLFNRAFLFGFNFKPSEAFHDYILTASPMASFYLGLMHRAAPEAADELVAFVAATEVRLRVGDKEIRTAEVHSLCIHPDHRGKRLVPPILAALYQQVLPHKIKQAVFSTAVPLPMCPVARAVHWGRPVNAELCVNAGYIQMQKTDNRDEVISKFRLPPSDLFAQLRPTVDADLPDCLALFHAHLKQYRLAPVIEASEFRFRVMSHPPFLHCWTARNANGEVIAFVSLYVLQSRWYTPRPTQVNVACLGYWAATDSTPPAALLTAAMHCAASIDCALLLATDVAGLGPALPALSFNEIKQSDLLYQLYNYQTSALEKSQVALQFW